MCLICRERVHIKRQMKRCDVLSESQYIKTIVGWQCKMAFIMYLTSLRGVFWIKRLAYKMGGCYLILLIWGIESSPAQGHCHECGDHIQFPYTASVQSRVGLPLTSLHNVISFPNLFSVIPSPFSWDSAILTTGYPCILKLNDPSHEGLLMLAS